jgi:2-oxoglutarate ferredoxin oxidoreductase subunit alpha
MRTLLINELEIDPERLTKVLHYDGTPITARYITQAITEAVHAQAVAPRRKESSK